MSEEGTAGQAASTDTGAATGDAGAASSSSGRERGAGGKFVAKAAGGQNDAGAASDAGQTEGASTDAPDWRSSILDANHLEFAKNLASPADAVKVAYDMRREISTRIKVPGKDATPDDIAKFRKALGGGEDEAAYLKAFPKPAEGVELSDVDKALQMTTAQVLLKHNVPVAAATELGAAVMQMVADMEAENERLAVKGRTDAEAELRKEWGGDFDANKQLAIRAVQTFGTQGLRDFLNERHVDGVKLGDHPEIIRFMGQVGRRIGEAQFIGAVGAEETKSFDDRINEFHAKYPLNHPERRHRQAELDALYEQRYGTAPADGRAA